jgi:hypothetical protein
MESVCLQSANNETFCARKGFESSYITIDSFIGFSVEATNFIQRLKTCLIFIHPQSLA